MLKEKAVSSVSFPQRLLVFLVLSAAGLAGNYFCFELFFNIQFLFGSIFAMLALQFLGLGWGTGAALLISGMTFYLWNHPYAMIIMTAEVMVVGLLQKRYKSSLVLADAAYWLFLGMPLVLLFYYGRMKLALDNAVVTMFKQAINGIFNAMVARLIFMVGGRFTWRKEKFTYAEIFFNVLTFFVLVPALGFLVVNSRQDLGEADQAIQKAFAISSQRIGGEIESWLLMHVARLEGLASEAERLPLSEMQKVLEQERRLDHDVALLGLMDRQGISVAYAPSLDEQGKKTVGRNFGDRPYLPILKRQLKSMFTEVMPGRVGGPQPMVGLVAPVLTEGKFTGYLGAALDLKKLHERMMRLVQSQALPNLTYLLLDQNRRVIVSGRDDLRTQDEFRRAAGSFEKYPGGVTLYLPLARKNISISERWQRGVYLKEIPIGAHSEWQLVLEQSTAPYQDRIYRKYAKQQAQIFFLLLTALMLAHYLSRLLTGSLAKVAATSSNLPERVASGSNIEWPESRISETNGLIENFREMSASLARKFSELRALNQDLDRRITESTKEIRESEEKYRNLVRNIEVQHFLFVMEPDGEFSYLSPSVEKMLGYSVAEFREKIGPLLAGHSEIDGAGEVIGARGREGENQTTNLKVSHRDGSIRWLEVVNSPILDKSGKTIAFQGIATDITERKQAEDSLRKREQQLRESQEVARLGSWERNLVSGKLEWSDEIYKLFDQDKEDFTPAFDKFSKWVHPEDLQAMRSALDLALQNDENPYQVVLRIINDSGREWVMEVRGQVRRDEAGRPLTIFGTAQDITERQRVEEAIRRSEEFVKIIHDTVDEGFIVVDRDYRILSANRGFCRQIGEESEKVVGRYCYEVSHNAQERCHEFGEDCAVREVFADGVSHVARHKHRDAEGNRIYVEIRAFPLKDSSGEVTAAIEVIHNITERHLLEAEQLKIQKLEAIGTLAGGIAHDFNNLLQGVFGFVSLAKLSARDPEKVCEMLDQAENALSLSVNLTNQLLTFAKGGKPVIKTINLRPVMENAARFALSGSRCEFKLLLPEDLWPVEVDEGQIAQVIQNIVLNASEAMPTSGTVEIRGENIESERQRRFVRISISDNGIGIPDKYLTRIFDPYFTTKQKGSGLGLATSYSIVRSHGGTIEAYSEPDRGSTFVISLPASAKATVPIGLPSAAAQEPMEVRRVLVMDDEEMVRTLVVRMLDTIGHVAEAVANGEEAVARYREAMEAGSPFDLVILDLTVKAGLGGKETIKRLLEIDPQVKAIVSSGYSDDPVVSDFRQYGFSGILNKPYNIGALRKCLDRLLYPEDKTSLPAN